MIKSILVALDDSKSSQSAKTLAFRIAKSCNATVTGIGVLDEVWIASPEAIPLGGAAFKVELDQKLMNDAKKRVHKLEKAFTEDCKAQDISAAVIDTSGIPSSEIEHFTTVHDLLVIGKDADFHSSTSVETAVSVKQLIKDNPRPVIITSPTLPNQDSVHILVAYDGTLASSRALHMAILLGVFKGKKVHIATINSDEKVVEDLLNTAAKLCQNHGIQAHLHPLVTTKKPAKALVDLSNELKPFMIVMGAYGHSGLAYFFAGSCVKDLLQSTDIPIFVYH